MPPAEPERVDGWTVLGVLAEGAQGRVLKVRRGEELGVLRILPGLGGDPDARAELEVLAQLDHPRLARLLDHGSVAGTRGDGSGSVFLVRSWIEGQPLVDWLAEAGGAERRARRLESVLVPLCQALEALHQRGFVHGDLKAGNIVIGADGPVLTDFGLSVAHGARRASGGISGTLFALAPEVLLGLELDARADLFALGVLLHELLLGRRCSAREFYARFPAQDYFSATGTRAEDLPEWARDVTAALLARVPSERPASAAQVGRRLAARLGQAQPPEPPEPLSWPAGRGREAFHARWIEALRARLEQRAHSRGAQLELQWIRVPEHESSRALAEDLRRELALAGSPSRRLDVERAAQQLGDTAALDRWARHEAAELARTPVFCALERPSTWELRALEALVRAAAWDANAVADEGGALVVVAPAPAPPAELGWTTTSLAPLEPAAIEAWLAELCHPAEARRAELAQFLVARCAGSAARLDRLVRRLDAAGVFLRGEQGCRLRPGPFTGGPASASSGEPGAERELDDLREPERRALAALSVLDGEASAAELAACAGLGRDESRAAVEHLVTRGLVQQARGGGRIHARFEAERLHPELALGEHEWRALHARRVEQLRRAGADAGLLALHVWRSEPGAEQAAALAAELCALRERGAPERALSLFEHHRQLARGMALAPDPEASTEAGLAWIALGRPERALASADELAARASPAARAGAECLRGAAAIARLDWSAASAHYERAAELDPTSHAGAVQGRAGLYFEARRDEELDELCRRATAGAWGALPRRVLALLDNLQAMSLFRRGRVSEARGLLLGVLQRARQDDDGARCAGTLLNLATLDRRSGAREQAIEHARGALAAYESVGHLPGTAQARALLGGLWREGGALVEAEQALAAAEGLRQRLGDAAGAVAARGMLGLVAADRGHLRGAERDLEHAARALRTAGRSGDAGLFEARAAEVRARFEPPATRGARRAPSEAERSAEADPRILVARARHAWLGGDPAGARELARRALALAARLEQRQAEAEARLVLEWLRRTGDRTVTVEESRPVPAEAQAVPYVDFDRAVLGALAGDLADAALAQRTWQLALAAAQQGRDDRALRLTLALCARGPRDGPDGPGRPGGTGAAGAAAAGVPWPDLLALRATSQGRVDRGLSALEVERLRQHLLGIPDPWPSDLEHSLPSGDPAAERDMDLVQLLEINHRLVQQEALKDLLGAIVEGALAVTGAERGFLVLEEDGELSFDLALDSRRGDIALPDVEVSRSIVRQTLEAGGVLRLSNAVDDPLLGAAPSVSALELRSILCAPFRVDERLRGVIYLDHRLQQGAFAERAERLLALLADQAVLAIRQVRRLEEIRRLNRELNKQVVSKESDLRAAQAVLREAQLALPSAGMVGSSPAMRAVHHLIERAAPSRMAVLVSGQSGTGKELVARALHVLSPRAEGPFITENCAAFPESLIESELFGYRKGAFTGAESDRAGLFERAQGGTLFLDEIGELPLELQAKLLRVLETGEVRRVGDSRVRPLDFRLVAATHRDLEADVRAGRFRADLFYRLDGLRIALPPLSERLEDIPELVDHFLRLEAARSGQRKSLAPAVLARLCRRPWRGNVRELANEVARLWVLSEGDIVDPTLLREPTGGAGPAPREAQGEPAVLTLEELERRAILTALEHAGGDKRRAAELLGISRAKVYQRLKEWSLDTGGE